MGLVHRHARNTSCAGCHPKQTIGLGAAFTKTQAVKIVVALIKADLQMVVFVEARKSSVCKMIRDKLSELRLKDGQLRALVTTRTLELGIDVSCNLCTIHIFEGESLYQCWAEIVRKVT